MRPFETYRFRQNLILMANTYTQIHIQIVIAVKYRQALILPEWKERLHQYITGIVQNHKHKMLAINSMPDHLHFFFGMRPHQSISDLMRIVSGDSSEWINQQSLTPRHFNWQGGYGAFSYRKRSVPTMINYILNQEKHHQKKTFLTEYRELLDEFEIEYNEQYIFKLPE